MATDPGWARARRGFWRYILFPTWQQRSGRVQEMPLLIWLRMMTLCAPATWLGFLMILLIVRKSDSRSAHGVTLAVIVAAVGVVCVAFVVWIRFRSLGGTEPVSVAADYRRFFFLGWALSTTPVLAGFVVYLEGGLMTVFAIGIVFGLIAIILNAPTRARLVNDQNHLPSEVVLLDALMLPTGAISPGPRR